MPSPVAELEPHPAGPSVRQRVWAAVNPDLPVAGIPRWHAAVAQVSLVLIALVLYLGVRLVNGDVEAIAFDNAASLVRFEALLGVDIERWLHDAALDRQALVTFFNWVYVWFHWPLLAGIAIVLYRVDTGQYVLLRNSMILSGAIGLVFFMSFPVAPPRFVEGFTDTVTELSGAPGFLSHGSFTNEYAALPSFHVGWNVLAGIALYRAVRFPPVRVFAVVAPMLMAVAVVLTANHWVIDGFVGTAVALVGLLLAQRIRRAVHARAAVASAVTETAPESTTA